MTRRPLKIGDVYREDGQFWVVRGIELRPVVLRIDQPGPEPVFTMSGVPIWGDGAWRDSGAAA